MSLSGKIFSVVALFIAANVAMIAFWIEAFYLGSTEFIGDVDAELFAPHFWNVVIGSVCCLLLTGLLLFWYIRRLVLSPLDAIVGEAERISSGGTLVMRGVSRRDEIGRLAIAFNRMAGETAEIRNNLKSMINDAVAESEKAGKEFALAERLAATGRLAANIANRINANLGTIQEALTRLRGNELTAGERTACLLRCEDGLRRLQDVMRSIFDLAKKRTETGPVSVGDVLGQAIELVRLSAEQSRISLAEEIDGKERSDDRLFTIADAGDLRHVFVNLLMNAIDAMPRGGVLTVRASRVLKWIIVEIIDTGVGLTLDEVSSSFDYFHSTKPGGKDVGVGLSVAHHIVVGYGGALTLNSRKGEGTKATVELPASGAPPPREPASAPVQAKGAPQRTISGRF